MPNLVDSVRLCRCFDAEEADLVGRLSSRAADKRICPAEQVEFEHYMPLHPEAGCLQRWLDLNA